MPPRFRSLLFISFFLVLTFWLATRTETGKNYGGQTLDKFVQDTGVRIDLGKSGGVDRLPFPGEEDAEEERKKHPKPADGQVNIEGPQKPVEDKADGVLPKLETTPKKTNPEKTSPKETSPSSEKAHSDEQTPEEIFRTVEDDGFQTNSSAEPQEQFGEEYDHITEYGRTGEIFGKTLRDLVSVVDRPAKYAKSLLQSRTETSYTDAKAKIYNPYPDYNSNSWKTKNEGTYKECEYPKDKVAGSTEDAGEVLVFAGNLKGFPLPSFGSYSVLDMDKDICYERETRLGAYGYVESSSSRNVDWDRVRWRDLQDKCIQRNMDRYDMTPKGNNFIQAHEYIVNTTTESYAADKVTSHVVEDRGLHEEKKKKTRSALLLRAYSGKVYSENDKQNIRALITELALKSGGEYEVFLLVQVKDDTIPIWSDDAAYDGAVQDAVPEEFRSITVLWNDAIVRAWYPKLSPPILPEKVSTVHVAQWLSVQKFAQEHPQFDFYWNWELDFRYTGHHYELLEKLSAFSAKQPRKGLWERNERFYNPAMHGKYETDFRVQVEKRSGDNTIWHAPSVPDVDPIGPKPPISKASEDNYEWGVGEDADYITLAPIFNPNNTAWVGNPDVWGYELSGDTPRRTTIITQSRCSKRLLDAMHFENLEGKHISSEMTPQTVALHHGLKAVYAPHPVFFDREWKPKSLERWFNGGPNGESGSHSESPFGWGRESRFQGSTWYYRADTPGRLYNNWMGWEDTEIGGKQWELEHGRTCLPPMLLHPIKDVFSHGRGYSSKSPLPY